MLGGSIYIITGTITSTYTGPASFLAYFIAGIVSLLNVFIFINLASLIPKSGSPYAYTYIVLGKFPAFVAGWSRLLEYMLSACVVTRGWSTMLDGLTNRLISKWILEHTGRLSTSDGLLAEYVDFLGLFLILLMSLISCSGIRGVAKVTGFFILFNLAVLFINSLYMLIYGKSENFLLIPIRNLTNLDVNSPNIIFLPFGLQGLIGGSALCFSAFIGLNALITCDEESNEKFNHLGRIHILSVLIIMIISIFSSLGLNLYWPWTYTNKHYSYLHALIHNKQNGGPKSLRMGMFYLIGCGCLFGLVFCLLANLIAAPRICLAMAKDKLLPNVCCILCEPFKTPVISIIFVTLLVILMDLIFSTESLAEFLSLSTLSIYSFASIGLIIVCYKFTMNELNQNPNTNTNMRTMNELTDVQNLSEKTLNRVGQPGYVKTKWARLIPNSVIHTFNSGRPGDTVALFLSIYVLLNVLLIIVLNVGALPDTWPIWRIVLVTIFITCLLTNLIIIGMFEQFEQTYSSLLTPAFVPVVPCLTISVNMFLISRMSWFSWVRFGFWIVMGLLIYFITNEWNSQITTKSIEQSKLAVKEEIVDQQNEINN